MSQEERKADAAQAAPSAQNPLSGAPETASAQNPLSGTPETASAQNAPSGAPETASAQNAPSGAPETASAPKRSMSVFLYILLLFSAALLLMCLSSLIHQRNNTEVLGELQNSVSVMQEVQKLQDKIITLQEERRELETQLEEAQAAQSREAARADASEKRVEALERLYIMEAQYQEGRYRACQGSIEAFAASGLLDSLPKESPGGGAASPLERYRQLQDAVMARLYPPTVEALPESVG